MITFKKTIKHVYDWIVYRPNSYYDSLALGGAKQESLRFLIFLAFLTPCLFLTMPYQIWALLILFFYRVGLYLFPEAVIQNRKETQ